MSGVVYKVVAFLCQGDQPVPKHKNESISMMKKRAEGVRKDEAVGKFPKDQSMADVNEKQII